MSHSPPTHAYPSDLAAAVLAALGGRAQPIVESPLLEPALFTSLLSTAYQASLLRDEGRPVIFRLLVTPPEALPVDGGPPEGLHVLPFGQRRVCDVTELRRLAAGAPYHRALIGVCIDAQRRPAMWGLAHVGTRWLPAQFAATRAELLAVVVSQDGGVRFACWRDGEATYWHYLSSGERGPPCPSSTIGDSRRRG